MVARRAGLDHCSLVRREPGRLRVLAMTKVIGIILIVLGVVGLAYGGLSWTRRDTIVDAGPIEITADKTERVPLPPIAGGLLLIAGVVLVMKK